MLELREVNKIYKGKNTRFQALYDVSLNIQKGEMVAIMGRSGSGKTTLLNIMGLMDRSDSGRYLLDGADVQKLTSYEASVLRNKKIGFVYQNFNLISDMSALQNVEMPMGYAGVGVKERKQRALEMLKNVDLADKAQNKPNELSGGQRQRVAIARALINSPDVILADEPTGNLDKKSGDEIMQFLCALNSKGVTIILVTHDMTVAGYASRIIRMEDGKII